MCWVAQQWLSTPWSGCCKESRWSMKHPFLIFFCPCWHISCLNVFCVSVEFTSHVVPLSWKKTKNTRVKNYHRLKVRYTEYRISVDRGQNRRYVTRRSMDYCILWCCFLKLGKGTQFSWLIEHENKSSRCILTV